MGSGDIPELTWYLTYRRNTSSVTRAGTVVTVMRCGPTSGLSGGKLARPVLDDELGASVVVTPLCVAGETWRVVIGVQTTYEPHPCLPG